ISLDLHFKHSKCNALHTKNVVDLVVTHTSVQACAMHPVTRMASQGGSVAVSLYEDVMRTMESALRQQPALNMTQMLEALPATPRGPHHTLVMEAVKAPTSSTTRVVDIDPAKIQGSIPESDRGPITVRRTQSITMASRQSIPSFADAAPESERPES